MDHNFSIDGKDKLKRIGVFNVKTNRNGLVRDHKFSRRNGFLLQIFPEILRHPANCELITHSENISKREKNSITLDQLFDKIVTFTQLYDEQELCLNLIEKFKCGEKYLKENYYEIK